jgi:hypothetical protein
MESVKRLPDLKYHYLAGPVAVEALSDEYNIGNCRRAAQLWFRLFKNISFQPEEMLNPHCFNQLGDVVSIDFLSSDWESALSVGDLIFGERIKDKESQHIDRGPEVFSSAEEYIISLHCAVVHSVSPLIVWHATAISGGSCYWDKETLLNYYKPVRVRRYSNQSLD